MLTTYTPSFDYSAITRANIGESTRTKYLSAMRRLVESGIDPMNHEQLAEYAASLPNSTRAFTKAALAIMVQDYRHQLKANATPENIGTTQAMLLRLEAMTETITVQHSIGTKAHIWLSQDQVQQITALPWTKANYTVAYRDYIVLAVLLGAGLRREELADLTFSSLKRLPNGNGYRDVLEITGKGDKPRVVPISPLLSKHLREWEKITGGGKVARSINKAGTLGKSLSVIGIFSIVREYGAQIDLPELDPHDCRRSFGRLGWEATRDLILIRDLLGHADAKTTQKYIGLDIKLDRTASDFIIRSDDFTASVAGD